MPAELLERWNRLVRARPHAPAVIDAQTEKIWSRREIDSAAATWRSEQGSGLAGLPVAFAEANGPAWMRIFIGVLQAGGVALPLDPTEPAEGRRRMSAMFGGRPRRRGACLIKLTSGSTGAPRAFAFTDAQMLADGRQICAAMGIRPNDLNLGLIPFGHSYGLGNLVLPLLAQGTPVLCGLSPLPQALAAAIERWLPTVFPAVPPLLRALAEADIPARRLASLRTVISAGAPLPPAVASQFAQRFGRKIHSFYGSTETGGIAYDRAGAVATPSDSAQFSGGLLPGVRIFFGTHGRFAVASPAVFTIGNRKKWKSLGRHSPPDLAKAGPRGSLTLIGRRGRQVKIAGRRLNPAEIENALRRLPGIADAWAGPDPRRSDALAAVVAGHTSLEAVRAALRPLLAAWKIPRRLIVISDFPRTARGKLDPARLRRLLAG